MYMRPCITNAQHEVFPNPPAPLSGLRGDIHMPRILDEETELGRKQQPTTARTNRRRAMYHTAILLSLLKLRREDPPLVHSAAIMPYSLA